MIARQIKLNQIQKVSIKLIQRSKLLNNQKEECQINGSDHLMMISIQEKH